MVPSVRFRVFGRGSGAKRSGTIWTRMRGRRRRRRGGGLRDRAGVLRGLAALEADRNLEGMTGAWLSTFGQLLGRADLVYELGHPRAA